MWAASGFVAGTFDRLIATALKSPACADRVSVMRRGPAAGGPPVAKDGLALLRGRGLLSPFTTALKSAPARNLGTDDFGTLMVAPVAGLRAVRAGRTAFSKTPNPVIATLSPLATVC